MAVNEIRKNDHGTILYATIYNQDSTILDISAATSKEILLLKPDGALVTGSADFYTTGTDGKLQYNIPSGTLDICGIWKLQWGITTGSGTWKTDIKTFKVYSNLN